MTTSFASGASSRRPWSASSPAHSAPDRRPPHRLRLGHPLIHRRRRLPVRAPGPSPAV